MCSGETIANARIVQTILSLPSPSPPRSGGEGRGEVVFRALGTKFSTKHIPCSMFPVSSKSFVKTLRLRMFLRPLLFRMRGVFVLLPRRRFAPIENIGQPGLDRRRWQHRARCSRRGNLLFAFRHGRGAGYGCAGLLQKIVFQRGNNGCSTCGSCGGNCGGIYCCLGDDGRVDRHADHRAAIRAGNPFVGIILIALDMLPARRTGKF